MYLSTDSESLRVYEALASEVRLQIIDLLYTKEMHIKELASVLYLSSAIVSTHVTKLQRAGLVSYKMKRVNGGTYKYCSLSTEYLQIKLSRSSMLKRKFVEVAMPVGQYTDFAASPTCGIATTEKMIGYYDNPTYFLDPERVHAGILWFARGFVEYKLPNYLFKDQIVQEIEISMEIGSEAPNINENWPSDIRFTINDKLLGMWTSPGDFGRMRGRFSPDWWHSDVNQYGLMKVLRINANGTFIDGQQISDVTIKDVQWDSTQWTLRISAEDSARGRGGLTLFGRGFGNYDQDIVIRSYYE
ncbi:MULTISPECIES: transcriptional regulator [unclassified Paenibacillus]|uniref:ArsR/SmtB family transcription factor n=1 Tax=unclassified Paenibacillus TaxID=185978 RepID=UPI00277DD704|nr:MULTISPECIES: ArsR family transcriptional regulator [unclassified Paenibacillus]MDQ0901951.1 putative transcriptional regulator [Paenibacillus sp. V4I7]MDQ0919554.1 putative transcriptional regulator [Paenibacillus sp. V4I5]